MLLASQLLFAPSLQFFDQTANFDDSENKPNLCVTSCLTADVRLGDHHEH